jgi:hypothetical protein
MATPRISQRVQEEATIPTPDGAEMAPVAALSADEQARIAQQVARLEMQRMAAEAEEAAALHVQRGEILIEKVIDPHAGRLATVHSYWAPLTPSMCTHPKCGWDAAAAVGFKLGWDSIPEDMGFDKTHTMREFVLEKLEQHKSIKHPMSGAPTHIRTAEQMKERAANRQYAIPEGFVSNPRL